MNFKDDILTLKNNVDTITNKLSALKGKSTLLTTQIADTQKKITECGDKRVLYKKSIEFVALVQSATKDKIKTGFEQIVIYAFQYIFGDNEHGFSLEFTRRGNLQELYFNVKTPDCERLLDPADTAAGGVLNILSLSLRIALLELMRPKVEGLLVWDEPFRDLSKGYLENADKFIKAINQKIHRQIVLITHKKIFLDPEYNLIKIGKEQNDQAE